MSGMATGPGKAEEPVQADERGDQAQEYRAIFEATGDGIIIADMEGHLVDANPALCQMHGYARAAMLRLSPTQFIHPDDHGIFAAYLASLTAGRSYRTATLDVRQDGTTFPVEVNGTVFTYRGQPHVLGVVRDISERVEVEEQLREREAQYRSIIDATSDGLVIRRFDGVIVAANPAACAMYGYAHEELVGLHVAALIHPEDRRLIAENQERIDGGGTLEARATHVRKDGTPFHVEVRGSAFTYLGAPHVLTAVRDITEHVAAEQAVLQERQRLSRELHDSVSQALYSIALGAKTARTLIGRDPTQVADALDFVLAQAERGLVEMRALIFALRPETLEQEGLAGVLRTHATTVQARYQLQVEVTMGAEPEVPLPTKEALYRIAQEALQNCVKHAHATQIHLVLSCTDDTLVLEVRDNGQGFNPDASFPGHLGLRSMRERVERLGGTLELESVVGEGTTVRARLGQGGGPPATTSGRS